MKIVFFLNLKLHFFMFILYTWEKYELIYLNISVQNMKNLFFVFFYFRLLTLPIVT